MNILAITITIETNTNNVHTERYRELYIPIENADYWDISYIPERRASAHTLSVCFPRMISAFLPVSSSRLPAI